MKKILSLFGTITLLKTGTTSLVACNTSQQYTEKQLKKLKYKNNIKTKDGILEGIVPQERPFNEVDNKGYFIVWRGEKTDYGRTIKFKHFDLQEKILDNYNRFKLKLKIGLHPYPDLVINVNIFNHEGGEFNINIYFKSVYRGNLNSQEPNLIVNKDGIIEVN